VTERICQPSSGVRSCLQLWSRDPIGSCLVSVSRCRVVVPLYQHNRCTATKLFPFTSVVWLHHYGKTVCCQRITRDFALTPAKVKLANRTTRQTICPQRSGDKLKNFNKTPIQLLSTCRHWKYPPPQRRSPWLVNPLTPTIVIWVQL